MSFRVMKKLLFSVIGAACCKLLLVLMVSFGFGSVALFPVSLMIDLELYFSPGSERDVLLFLIQFLFFILCFYSISIISNFPGRGLVDRFLNCFSGNVLKRVGLAFRDGFFATIALFVFGILFYLLGLKTMALYVVAFPSAVS